MAEGPILQRARAHIPQTWDALARSSVYGSELLQQRADTIKFRLFATVIDGTLEATTYNPLLLDYAAKCVALQVIPAGADYWSDQLVSETTTGTNETVSFPDRIGSLWRIHARLLAEVEELASEVNVFLPRPPRRIALPEVSDSTFGYRTPNPYRTTPALGATTGVYAGVELLPWGAWR